MSLLELNPALIVAAMILALLILFFAAGALSARKERRLLQSLIQKSCSSCGGVFGEAILGTLWKKHYMWDPAPGSRLDPDLNPSDTWTITYSRYGEKVEFDHKGRVFVPPAKGVERVGEKSK